VACAKRMPDGLEAHVRGGHRGHNVLPRDPMGTI
jgi:hypothetical protein